MDLTYKKVCEPEVLDAALVAQGLVKGVHFSGTSTSEDSTIVHMSAENLSDDERALVDAAVAVQDELAFSQNRRRELLSMDCREYIYAHYDQARQASFNALLTEALAMGYTNRAAYIGQFMGWTKTVIGHYYEKADELKAASTEKEVAAVTWDFAASFDKADPRLALRTAVGMMD